MQTVNIGPTSGGIGSVVLSFMLQEISSVLGLPNTMDALPAWCVTNGLLSRQPKATANGDVTVTVPAGASGVIILPPNASVVVKTLKGITGDTGFRIHPAALYAWAFDQAAVPTSFVITATAIETLILYFP